eukprot:UN29863
MLYKQHQSLNLQNILTCKIQQQRIMKSLLHQQSTSLGSLLRTKIEQHKYYRKINSISTIQANLLSTVQTMIPAFQYHINHPKFVHTKGTLKINAIFCIQHNIQQVNIKTELQGLAQKNRDQFIFKQANLIISFMKGKHERSKVDEMLDRVKNIQATTLMLKAKKEFRQKHRAVCFIQQSINLKTHYIQFRTQQDSQDTEKRQLNNLAEQIGSWYQIRQSYNLIKRNRLHVKTLQSIFRCTVMQHNLRRKRDKSHRNKELSKKLRTAIVGKMLRKKYENHYNNFYNVTQSYTNEESILYKATMAFMSLKKALKLHNYKAQVIPIADALVCISYVFETGCQYFAQTLIDENLIKILLIFIHTGKRLEGGKKLVKLCFDILKSICTNYKNYMGRVLN